MAFVRLLRRAEVGEPRLGIGGSEQQGVVAGQCVTQTRTPPRGKERWREEAAAFRIEKFGVAVADPQLPTTDGSAGGVGAKLRSRGRRQSSRRQPPRSLFISVTCGAYEQRCSELAMTGAVAWRMENVRCDAGARHAPGGSMMPPPTSASAAFNPLCPARALLRVSVSPLWVGRKVAWRLLCQ